MDLYSGLPYWIVKNPLYDYVNRPERMIETKIAVIGSGITGAIVSHLLCEAGLECSVFDKRSIGTGSSSASTALLQYEIDTPLAELSGMVGEKDAVTAYGSCLRSIYDLEELFSGAGVDASFEWKPSLFLAAGHKGREIIRREIEIRERHGLPFEYLSRQELKERFGISRPCALWNNVSGQIDTYKSSTGLFKYNIRRGRLRVYPHTDITGYERTGNGYRLDTADGTTIKCEYLIIAAGFEAGMFLPENLMRLTTTFAFISHPVDPATVWQGGGLIWETGDPYLYIRQDGENRVIVGGEDIGFNNRTARKFLMPAKTETLRKKVGKLLPYMEIEPEMSWSGTFSSTSDGLPLIGPAGDPNMLFALGYGGNGITFSMIAAQILTARLTGKKDPREKVFALDRKSIKNN